MSTVIAMSNAGILSQVRERWILLGLFLFGLAIRLGVIVGSGFDGLYGQDAFAYLDYTKQILELDLAGPFYWPLGYPALAAFGTLFVRDPVVGAQAVNVLFGALLPLLIYQIIGLVLDALGFKDVVLFKVLGGFIAALAGQLIHSSVVIMSDMSALFWALLSLYALLQLNRSSSWVWLYLFILPLALAIATRWLYAGLLLPFSIYFVIAHYSLLRSSRFVLFAILSLLLIGLQFVFSQNSAEPVLGHIWLENWNLSYAFQTMFDTPDGRFQYRWPPLVFYASPLFHPYYLFPLLTPFVLAGMWRLRASRVLIPLGGWVMMLYLFLIGIPFENFRFGLAFFPPVIIFAVVGLAVPPFSLRRWILTAVFVSLIASVPFTYKGLSALFDLKSRELGYASYVEKMTSPGSTVITFSATLTLDHYTDVEPVDLYVQSPVTLQALMDSASQPVYVFVQIENLETQWVGKAPLVNYLWLRDSFALREIGTYDDWVLYSTDR
ncbi:MAG: hypothetical protein QY328_09690 [Anaerolineales bacterium]|nr:MAG: hypothetical protein QY328_09690 [Anaerolineales bacterium]